MSSRNLNSLAVKLKELHVSGNPLLLANVWDASSAQAIASHTATMAVATASYAIASTQGIEDNDMTAKQNLTGVRNVVAGLRKAGKADSIPLSADLQDGYDGPGETIKQAIALGVVGCNLEDVDNTNHTLRSIDDASNRISTVLRAAEDAGVPDFVVNARTDVLGYGGNIKDVIERGKAYLERGATTVFVWGVGKWDIKEEEVEEMVAAFHGNLAVQPGSIGIKRLTELGVSRISVGPALWRKSNSVLVEEAQTMGLF
ncbi:hypothetical protein LTS08_005869 [Lithohypha guttulata]|uniref:uncharacterized protein n=1 Tax=Lithohypha guttulata TaxID=1690604 RepID=UPI002DDDDE87|nr:hypothetical protein LTR51_002382 [Lithohypha guttulata]KAK5099288.1 hypothetical protein LTS08_005869 [Lithohypha guttulata]